MSYPFISKMYYEYTLPNVTYQYSEQVQLLQNEEIDSLLDLGYLYNSFLLNQVYPFEHTEEQYNEYKNTLLMDDNTIMGSIEIPTIDVVLPIYHGTSDAVLNQGVGHLSYSTLPIGGIGSHAVLLGHTGLANKSLFTPITKLSTGDVISIEILGQQFDYEVFDTMTILPNEIDYLKPIEQLDLLSLVTCTPYGIGTHRYVVTARRI